MRVLHLSAGNLFGGVETYLVTLARCRATCPDMEPEFALCFPGRLRDELTAAGVPVHDPGPVRVSRPWTVLRGRGNVKRLLRARRFDAAVAHSSWPHALFAPVVRRAGVRLAYALHGEVDRSHWLNRWASRTEPDVVLANSDFIAKGAEGWFHGVPIRTCHPPVIPTPLDDREAVRREIRSDLGTRPDAVVILQASRLEAWKGQRDHIEALGRLRETPEWEAWFAGGAQRDDETAFLAELQSLAAARGVADRVKFLGQRSDVPRLMAAADVLCQPNAGPEPFGIAFIEALSAGLPVVTSNFGGGAEILDDTCGVLTPPGDPAAVAAALAILIRDPSRRAALGANGPRRAEQLCDPLRQLHRLRDHLSGPPPC